MPLDSSERFESSRASRISSAVSWTARNCVAISFEERCEVATGTAAPGVRGEAG